MQQTIEAWLRLAAERVHAEAATLTALDQAIGDGDHGTNLDRGFTAIMAALDAGVAIPEGADDRAATAAVLRAAGRALISTVGGASGPLFGTAFLKASAAVGAGAGSTAESIAAALEAAAAGISTLGKSTTGEKTMLDTLVPAAEAARRCVTAGGDARAVLAAATEAAEHGRDATIPMLATKGRASYLGERSIGHQDPGATSATLLLAALGDALD